VRDTPHHAIIATAVLQWRHRPTVFSAYVHTIFIA